MRIFITKNHFKYTLSITGFILIFLVWTILSRLYIPLILPSPGETFTALNDLYRSGELLRNLLITVRRTLIGFSLAVFTGIFMALILNKSLVLKLIFRPIITVIQITPPVIWLALAVIWFGIADNFTPVFLIFIVTFPIIFINIYEGLQNLDNKLIEMAEVYGMTRKQIYIQIFFPGLVPYLVSSVSVGLAFAWKSSIFAEFLGSNSGIGYALSTANSNLNTPKLFAWTLILIVLMLLVEYLIIRPLQGNISRWRQYG
ncbi:MAG: ABC transporter permease [Bacillota bacterium]